MRNITFWSGFGFAMLTILSLFAILISVVTYSIRSVDNVGLLGFLARNHLWIMLLTIFLSIGYGYISSFFLQKKIIQEQNVSQNILDIVLSFLNSHESAVLKHLVDKNGLSTQSAISRINQMGGVKALRTVQKLQERNIVSIHKEGKVRKIVLNCEMYSILENKDT